MKRIFLIVLDSLGIGALPDADKFGDVGADTLRSVYSSGELCIPNLIRLGLGNVDGIDYLKKQSGSASVCRLSELSAGKDTTSGHWEMAGIVSKTPMPTYKNGFPKKLIKDFEERIGMGTLCGLPYSGTAVINDYGAEHLRTKKPIIYTSQDSVFQIACHEDTVPLEKLYEYCTEARKMLVGENAVGRVIARPFTGNADEGFTRTANRRDFSLEPNESNMLSSLADAGLSAIGIGKIGDIFAGKHLTESYPTHSNAEGMQTCLSLMDRDFKGLCFLNLVDFDMLYGHRNDKYGYARALNEFDEWLNEAIPKLNADDVIMITGDHGCDPDDVSTDHTREYTPLIIYGSKIKNSNLGTVEGFCAIGKTVCSLLGAAPNFTDGEDLSSSVLKI